MKHIILQTLFGWLTRPILLWNITDILTILAEIFIIATIISVVRDIRIMIRRKKNNGNIEIGDYVRTDKGEIFKVLEIEKGSIRIKSNYREWIGICRIVKHSKNISKLIESGDILKIKEGNLVCYISWNKEYDISLEEIQKKAELLAIITKEQAKTIEYEVNK